MEGFRQLRIPVPDAALSLCLLAVAESQVWLGWHDGGDGTPGGTRWVEAVILALPAIALAWRRRSPTAAAVVVGGAAVLQVAAVAPYAPFLPLLLPLLLVNYANAAYGRARGRIIGLAAVTGGVAAVVGFIPQARTSSEALFSAVVVAGSWLVGDAVRQRQRRVEVVEASRAEWARATVADERVRIARELHDVVAHSVSLMGVQAGAARMLLDEDVGKAREALASIETTARDSVAELQRLLGILRASDADELEPQPTLSDLAALADATRAAGLAVNLHTDSLPPELGPGPSLAVYRIVQEALTNVVKHAQATQADVRVAVAGDALEVEVADDGRGVPLRRRHGHGLIGMRERATLYGGTLEAGRRSDGGFTIRARFPLNGQST
ncbi:MAG TPA: sensor histidine kinase [Gaiellaceae bacterium]|nr:sensor histidine kinase [Gaiellaceae bacterium]